MCFFPNPRNSFKYMNHNDILGKKMQSGPIWSLVLGYKIKINNEKKRIINFHYYIKMVIANGYTHTVLTAITLFNG